MKTLLCPNCSGEIVEDLQRITWVDIVLIPIFGIGILIILYKLRNKPKDGSHNYTCRLCRHAWTWLPGTPYPEINVRPELIASGKKRLEQEQASNNYND